jgi:hypothetical protein
MGEIILEVTQRLVLESGERHNSASNQDPRQYAVKILRNGEDVK